MIIRYDPNRGNYEFLIRPHHEPAFTCSEMLLIDFRHHDNRSVLYNSSREAFAGTSGPVSNYEDAHIFHSREEIWEFRHQNRQEIVSRPMDREDAWCPLPLRLMEHLQETGVLRGTRSVPEGHTPPLHSMSPRDRHMSLMGVPPEYFDQLPLNTHRERCGMPKLVKEKGSKFGSSIVDDLVIRQHVNS